MTTRSRILITPELRSQLMASKRTSRGAHAQALVELATDAATGHPGQRATVLQNSGGSFYSLIHPDTTARVLQVAFSVSWNGAWAPPDAVTVKLSITDTVGGSIPYTDATISAGLRGETTYPGLGGGRLDSFHRVVCYLDKYALIAAGLSATDPWILKFLVTCGATVYCESIEVSEVSRFTIDDTEPYGDFQQNYPGRSPIDTHLSRIEPTLYAAYYKNRRTYHAMTLDEATPDVVTSAVLAVIPGSQDFGGGAPRPWIVRPRRILGEPQLLWGVRYRTTGANDGVIELATTGFGSPYSFTLPGTSGAWAVALSGGGSMATLADASADTIQWRASIAGGDSLKISSYWVCDEPF